MEIVEWNGKKIRATDLIKSFEEIEKIKKEKIYCQNPECQRRELKFICTKKIKPHFKHYPYTFCKYEEYLKKQKSQIRIIKNKLYEHLSKIVNTQMDVLLDNTYIHLLMLEHNCKTAIHIFNKHDQYEKIEKIDNICKKYNYNLQIVVNEKNQIKEITKAYYIERYTLEKKKLLLEIIPENNQVIEYTYSPLKTKIGIIDELIYVNGVLKLKNMNELISEKAIQNQTESIKQCLEYLKNNGYKNDYTQVSNQFKLLDQEEDNVKKYINKSNYCFKIIKKFNIVNDHRIYPVIICPLKNCGKKLYHRCNNKDNSEFYSHSPSETKCEFKLQVF